jgi:hypothetical protein
MRENRTLPDKVKNRRKLAVLLQLIGSLRTSRAKDRKGKVGRCQINKEPPYVSRRFFCKPEV